MLNNCSYSRHSLEASFCDECKCFVCSECDCTVFHLSYQEQLWRELTETESSAKQKSAESKRAKKQKKKKKGKDKKKDRLEGAAKSHDVSNDGSDGNDAISPRFSGGSSSGLYVSGSSSADDEKAIGDKTRCIHVVEMNAGKVDSMRGFGSPAKSVCWGGAPGQSGKESVQLNHTGQSTAALTMVRRKRIGPSKEENSSKSSDGAGGTLRAQRGVERDDGTTDPSLSTRMVDSKGDDDDLVSYLQQTGSILKLAEMLDDGIGDNDDDITEADMLALQEAAANARKDKGRGSKLK